MKSLGYAETTSIQAQALPALLAGKDVVTQADTGTGKTAAFALGSLSRVDATSPFVPFIAGDPKSIFFQKDTLGVSGSVPIKLTDYGVKVPEMLLLKTSNDVRLNFSVQAGKR